MVKIYLPKVFESTNSKPRFISNYFSIRSDDRHTVFLTYLDGAQAFHGGRHENKESPEIVRDESRYGNPTFNHFGLVNFFNVQCFKN